MSLLNLLGTSLKNNTKTLNGQSIIGSGNISVSLGGVNTPSIVVSTDKNYSYGIGDVYINSRNVAYLSSDFGWIEIGTLMYTSDTKRNNRSISCGTSHTLFLLKNGTVKAVGYNTYGTLGDGSSVSKTIPVQVLNVSNCIAVSAGASHSMFLLSDGTVKSTGQNNYGCLGIGNTTTQLTPVTVSGITGCVDIASGNNFTLFLMSDKTVKSVGYNAHGQLANNTVLNKNVPSNTVITNCIGISAGSATSLFLLSDGTVKGSGYNATGQLGLGNTTTVISTVTSIPGISNCIGVAAGSEHSMFLLTDGTVKSTGRNNVGQLGDGTLVDKSSVVSVLNVSSCISIAVGSLGNHTLFLLDNGTVKAVGGNTNGQLGDSTIINKSTAVNVHNVYSCKFIFAGAFTSFFVLKNDSIRVSGHNNYIQLGSGSTTDKSVPYTTTFSNTNTYLADSPGVLI